MISWTTFNWAWVFLIDALEPVVTGRSLMFLWMVRPDWRGLPENFALPQSPEEGLRE